MKNITCYINSETEKNPPPWDISKATRIVDTDTNQSIMPSANQKQMYTNSISAKEEYDWEAMTIKACQEIDKAMAETEYPEDLFINNRVSINTTCRNSKKSIYGIGVTNFFQNKYFIPYHGDKREGIITVVKKDIKRGFISDIELEACVLYNSLVHLTRYLPSFCLYPIDIYTKNCYLYNVLRSYIDRINKKDIMGVPKYDLFQIDSDTNINILINYILKIIAENKLKVRVLYVFFDTQNMERGNDDNNKKNLQWNFSKNNLIEMSDKAADILYNKSSFAFMVVTPPILRALYARQYVLDLKDNFPFNNFRIEFFDIDKFLREQAASYELINPVDPQTYHDNILMNIMSTCRPQNDVPNVNLSDIFRWNF